MKKIILGVVVTLGMSQVFAQPSDSAIAGLQVSFGDFGSGASHAPQSRALELVAESIKQKNVDKYVLQSIQHHGEISFCVLGNDLSELSTELKKLQPTSEAYSLSIMTTATCE